MTIKLYYFLYVPMFIFAFVTARALTWDNWIAGGFGIFSTIGWGLSFLCFLMYDMLGGDVKSIYIGRRQSDYLMKRLKRDD